MKTRNTVLATLVIAVGAFSLGRMLPRKNVSDDVPEWMQDAAAPSAATKALLKRMETDFAEGLDATSEKVRDSPYAQSQRPVLFKNRIVVPQAAVALWNDNENLKLTKSKKNAIMEKEAEGIDFWVAKVPMTKFWEGWVETVARSREYADVPLPRPYEEWLGKPRTPPRPLRSIAEPGAAPVAEIEGLTGYMTSNPEPTQGNLIKQLEEAQAEYAKSADATPDKLETLPPSESLRPVLFRGKIVPQAAQTLYEDNERLKLLKSGQADYNIQAEDPEYWVPKVRPSAFWSARTQATAAAKTAAASAGSKPRPDSSTAPKSLEGKLGYMTGNPEAGTDSSRAADAGTQLKDLAMRRGAAEQKRRTLQDRKAELTGMGLQFKMDKVVLAADFESYKASLAAYNREVAKLEEQRTRIDQRNPLAVAAFNAKLEKSEEKKRALDKAGSALNARQKEFLAKLQPLAEEEKRIDTEIPVLTENIIGLIKEFTAVQSQMFGTQK